MMKIYIDTEFDGFNGPLISMGLACADGREFYTVLDTPVTSDWVKENVVPILNREPETRETAQSRFAKFLSAYEEVEVIADWPEDLAHFCQFLITGPGTRLDTPELKMKIVREDFPSKLPHNALEDAKGIKAGMESK